MTAREVSFEQLGKAGIRPFASDGGTIAVAVSGGSDSLALLAWAHKHAHASDHRLLVLTVDHRLRAGSETDAKWVVKFAEAIGYPARILKWTEPVGQQDAARNARHRLLAVAAKACGAEALLFGHTFDDVIETCLLRRRRNRRTKRLAGPAFISPSPIWPAGNGLTLCRPLLWQRRAHLRDELRRNGLVWREDPSNASPKYERNRIRRFLTQHPRTVERLVDPVEAMLTERHTFDRTVAETLKKGVSVDADSLIRVEWDGISSDVALARFGLLIRIANGSDRTPRAHTLANALDQIPNKGDRTTVAGAWLQRASGGLLIGRDPGAPPHSTSDEFWDGRFELASENVLPATSHILVRDSLPPTPAWREILSARIRFEADSALKSADLQVDVETLKTPISLQQAPPQVRLPQSEDPV